VRKKGSLSTFFKRDSQGGGGGGGPFKRKNMKKSPSYFFTQDEVIEKKGKISLGKLNTDESLDPTQEAESSGRYQGEIALRDAYSDLQPGTSSTRPTGRGGKTLLEEKESQRGSKSVNMRKKRGSPSYEKKRFQEEKERGQKIPDGWHVHVQKTFPEKDGFSREETIGKTPGTRRENRK